MEWIKGHFMQLLVSLLGAAVIGLTTYVFHLENKLATHDEKIQTEANRNHDQYSKMDQMIIMQLNSMEKERDFWRDMYFTCQEK